MTDRRMDYQGKIATVLGGSGFIGTYVTEALARAGYTVKVASRFPVSAYQLRLSGFVGQVVPVFCNYANDESLQSAIKGSNLVVNCVGILFEKRKHEFEKIHLELPRNLAKICASLNVERLVHISALACDKGKSKYARSKLAGEQAICEYFPSATILRPSVVFGPEDDFFNKFAKYSTILPVLPSIGGGHTKFQPVYVGDVARAVAEAAQNLASAGQIYELTGPETITFEGIYNEIERHTGRRIHAVHLPVILAHLQATLFSIMPSPPLTHDRIVSLETDNVASGHLPTLSSLGITPVTLETILPLYLDRYRSGGKFAERKRA